MVDHRDVAGAQPTDQALRTPVQTHDTGDARFGAPGPT